MMSLLLGVAQLKILILYAMPSLPQIWGLQNLESFNFQFQVSMDVLSQ